MTLGGLKGHHAASGKDKESFSAMSWLQQWAIWLQTKPSRFCFLAICGHVETEQWKQLLASSLTRAGGSFGVWGLAWSFVGLCREVSGGRFRKGGGHFADGPYRRSRGWRDGLRGDGTRCDQSCWCWWKKEMEGHDSKELDSFCYWCHKRRMKDREWRNLCRPLNHTNCGQFWSHHHIFRKDPSCTSAWDWEMHKKKKKKFFY